MLKQKLDLLVTEGGKLAVLLMILAALMVTELTLHLTGRDPQETGRTLLSDAFTSIFTAIVMKLQDGRKDKDEN